MCTKTQVNDQSASSETFVEDSTELNWIMKGFLQKPKTVAVKIIVKTAST